jgi:hypothetical protein
MLDKNIIHTNIIDIGSGTGPAIFPKSTHVLDFNNQPIPGKISIKLDLDFDTFNESRSFYNFAFCRHTLEDIQNPQHAFSEITRIAKMGYIETPSPLVELTSSVQSALTDGYKGYIHHRYIVWSDIYTNTLHFLPKMPLVEYVEFNPHIKRKFNHLLNNYPVYWNNYYIWDHRRAPNIIVYRNDINFKMNDDYQRLLNLAIFSSISYTNFFVDYIS